LINGKKIYSGCSIGISLYPSDGETAELLLSHADSAMYSSKQSGRNKYNFYSKTMTDEATHFLQMGTEVKEALKNDEFVLYYQPVMNVASQQCFSMEALIRWNHPERGMIPPSDFLPIIHKSGLNFELDEWVLNHAVAAYKSLQEGWNIQGNIAINITVETLLKKNFAHTLSEILLKHGVEPKKIVLEIVETSLIIDMEKAQLTIAALHNFGVKIAVDDFGTGYSSLSYILDIDVDFLKIDQSFIKKIGVDEKNAKLINSIIGLSKIIGVETIAEGVETEEQLHFLTHQGVDSIQGYHYAKPMDIEGLIDFLNKRKI
jgi:EAL domain-containing protein (putative c-di-GMP-specific phosphodiesterase class I)